MEILIIFFGGGAGSVTRYLLINYFNKIIPSSIPYGTMLVNLTGALIIGIIYYFIATKLLLNEQLKILNRRGKDRISVKQNINFSKNNFFQYMNLFTTTDINGNLIQIDMNGNVVKNNYSLEENNTIEIKMDNILLFIIRN